MKRQRFLPGSAFSDSVVGKTRREGRLKESFSGWWSGHGRTTVFSLVLFIAFFILIVRLFTVTLIDGHRYRLLADGNRTRELVRHAPRGNLVDRTGKPLTESVIRYRLIGPCDGTGGSCTVFLTEEEADKRALSGLAPGEFLEIDYLRKYLYPEVTAHVVGYTGEITGEELSDEYFSLRSYRPADRIGRDGAEAVFEEELRGRDGKELVEVDASGRIVRTLGIDREIAGSDVILSLDVGLSEVVRRVFPEDKNGAVVVENPQTGEILALYSHPSYDPNRLSAGISAEGYSDLAGDERRPLFNRTIGGVYPPGSTYKIVTALAGLEDRVFTAESVVEDTGVVTIGTFSFANWYFTQYGKTEGFVNVVKALKRSNDIFFYLMGEKIGIERLAFWSRKMGIGKLSGIELTGEATGLMPDPDWKARNFTAPSDQKAGRDRWYAGDTYHVSIGQGYLLTTPLQVSMWTSTIASGGKLCKPTVAKVRSGKHEAACFDLGLKRENLEIITSGLTAACETGGTGYPFFGLRVNEAGEASSSGRLLPVACKTGTAETGDAEGTTHAWFTAFAPIPAKIKDSAEAISGLPEIAVTVLVEEGGEGSQVAAPVAREILLYWFGR